MEFFTYSNEKRPIRLCEATRQFAYDSLNHKYGQEARRTPAAVIPKGELEGLSELQKYNICIREIVRTAPVRVCEGELLSGAATLGMAIDHLVPATYRGGAVYPSVSHLTVDFSAVLSRGMNGIEEDAKNMLTKPGLSAYNREFLESVLFCIGQMREWREKYLCVLRGRHGYEENYQNLSRVPFLPAESFYEAVQSLWFSFAFIRLCGNWPGIGRIDEMLGPYLKNDLESGKITIDEAREILAHFFIKGCEWIEGGERGSGDAQHYQNIVLGGVNSDGVEVTNEVTYLVLDIIEELPIGDFPTTVRIGKNSPEKLLRRVAQVMKHGGGVLAVYNEDGIIESLTSHGYKTEEARNFANDGCWEIQVPGRTNFIYIPFDGLGILLHDTLRLDEDTPAHFDTYDELETAYFHNLGRVVHGIYESLPTPTENALGHKCNEGMAPPCTVVSIFEGGCIENAVSYNDGGTIYTIRSPHIGGASDVGNSLHAIDRLCFRDNTVNFDDFMTVLKENWDGHEALRQYVLNKIPQFGNDNDEADAYTVRVVDKFAEIVLSHKGKEPIRFVPGVSTFGRQIEWRYLRPASPHGHRRGDILAPNLGATPGSDMLGATALICSYCKADLKNQVTGAALDLKLLPSSVRGEDGTDALVALMRGFVALGGCFLQPDVLDAKVLREAQEHPERYQSLSIRVSGWNARFVTLNREWQDMCINMTEHGGM